MIGQTISGRYVYGMDQLAEVVAEKGITVAISTVPSRYSQMAIDAIVDAGITAILNFAPDPVIVPKDVNIQYIDLTTELQTLIFLIRPTRKNRKSEQILFVFDNLSYTGRKCYRRDVMQVTRKETVYEMPGNQPNVGDKAADFRLKSLEDKEYTLTDF